jgi:PAS domain S-box-containing protein
VLATFFWAAYRRVEATLIQAASDRLQGAANQIASLLDGQRATERLRQLGSDRDLRRFLKTRTEDARQAARARLSTLAGSSQRRVELWDDSGTRLLEIVASGTADPDAAPKTLPAGAAPSFAGIGPLQGSEEIVFNDAIAEILDEPESSSSSRLGYVRVRSTFTETPKGIFGRLVGRDAEVRIGNRAGGPWTDLSRMVPAAKVDLSRSGVTQVRDANGELRLGAVALVRATPWAVWVSLPMADIVAPARLFMNRTIVVALLFVAAAAVLATVLAARITIPLSRISAAAARLAARDYGQRVDERRLDEIGHLARTFNAMAAEIEAASAALKKSEERYRLLFASNPQPMWVYDVETLRFLDVNDMATVHYGYSRDEFLAMTIKDIRPSEELPALLDNVSRLAPMVERSGIWKHRKKDGTIIDVEVSSHELLLDGRAARVVLAHDVTAELAARQALQESEAMFRGMAETMPHVVWTARPDGVRTYYNQRWFEYTGLSFEETLGLSWQQALHPDDRDETVREWEEAIRTGLSRPTSYRLKQRDGVYRWHIGRAAPLTNESGRIAMWVGTITDVDDARRDQEMLKTLNTELEERVRARTAELEAANDELESFSYSVSHDLRAPLRHVQGYVGMLTAEIEEQLTDKSTRYLKTITGATKEMGQLIDNLLAFSRMGRVHVSERSVSLDGLVRDVVASLEMATRGRNIHWTLGPLPVVIGDPSLLKQVFANLLGNAVKYTRGRDPAEIEIGCADEEAGRRVLFVRDNGAGFDMKYVDKLFGVFQRLHRADEFEGTGIGLATVRRIIARHGGRTWAEGKVDEGATIYISLRAAATSDHQSIKAS